MTRRKLLLLPSSSPLHISPAAANTFFHPIINGTTSSEFINSLRKHYSYDMLPTSTNYSSRSSSSSSSSPVDSSMALTILVLLTAIFFMGFFSIYIRRLARQVETAGTHHRFPPPQPSEVPEGRFSVNRKGKGLDLSIVQSLPLVSYTYVSNGEDAKQLMITGCPICLTEFEVKEIVRLIPHCKHLFHPLCLDTWLSSHVSCPVCRSTKLFCTDGVGDGDGNGDGEICLDVKEVHGSSNDSGVMVMMMERRSTVDGDDTSVVEPTQRVIRSRSYTYLDDPRVLQRSLSF